MKTPLSIKNIYLGIASMIGLVGLIIGYGWVFSQWFKQIVITDEEYLSNQYGHDYSCEEKFISPTATGEQGKSIKRNETEKATCIQETKTQRLNQRRYEAKVSIIDGLIRWTLFLLLFASHAPFFFKKTK